MANTVFKLRRSSVAGKVPNTSTLAIGELGLNLTDRKLYSSDGTNVWETGANLTTLTVSTNTNVNNVIFPNTGGIYANGSFGLDTQVLKSNGSAIYWGTGGSGGGSIQLINQQYTGDGSTTTFPVSGGYDSNTLYVYVNGVLLRKGVEVDVISGTDFTIYNPPPNGAFIDVFGTGLTIANGFSTTVSQQFTANGNSNTFTVASGFIPTTLQVYLNGVKQIPAVDYTTTGGNTVNFFSTPPNNYIVDVFAYNTTVLQSAPVRQSNTADGTSVNYVISGGYIPGQLDTYVNGVKINPTQANVSSGYNVTFDSPPPAGAELSFVGFVPTNYIGVNTSASYVWSNTQTFANVFIIGTAGINANNSYGTNGQVLTSNGTSVYWSNSATFVRQTFTGTGACTTFQVTGGYTPYNLDVYVTGVKQLSNTDVTISSGNNIVFTVAPPNNASIEVVGVIPLNYTYANQSYDYIWTGKHTYGNSTVNTTVNSSLISIGNTSVNTQIVAGNVYLNGSTLLIGNSSSNVVINGTTITVSNSTSNVSFGPGPANINAIATNTFTIGSGTYFAANGNVGIGNSSPGAKLSVDGEAFFGRADSSLEGGEIKLARSSDNLAHYSIDCYGSSTTPSMRFIDNVAGAVRMGVDSSGRVTMPYQPFVAASKNNGTGWANYNNGGVGLVYIFNNAYTNNGNHYNTTTGIFTCPVAGYYKVNAAILMGNNGSLAGYFYLYKNGGAVGSAAYFYGGSGVASGQGVMEWIVYCAANDQLKIHAIGGSGAVIYDQGYNSLTIALIG